MSITLVVVASVFRFCAVPCLAQLSVHHRTLISLARCTRFVPRRFHIGRRRLLGLGHLSAVLAAIGIGASTRIGLPSCHLVNRFPVDIDQPASQHAKSDWS